MGAPQRDGINVMRIRHLLLLLCARPAHSSHREDKTLQVGVVLRNRFGASRRHTPDSKQQRRRDAADADEITREARSTPRAGSRPPPVHSFGIAATLTLSAHLASALSFSNREVTEAKLQVAADRRISISAFWACMHDKSTVYTISAK